MDFKTFRDHICKKHYLYGGDGIEAQHTPLSKMENMCNAGDWKYCIKADCPLIREFPEIKNLIDDSKPNKVSTHEIQSLLTEPRPDNEQGGMCFRKLTKFGQGFFNNLREKYTKKALYEMIGTPSIKFPYWTHGAHKITPQDLASFYRLWNHLSEKEILSLLPTEEEDS